jgi:hypothetical protein
MTQKYEMDRILAAPDKGVTETKGIGGILARLWRQTLLDLNIKGPRFEILLSEFIILARRGVNENKISRHFTRGNLRRELEKEKMTFKVFMKGMKFLKIKKIRFAIELEHGSGRKTLHQTVIDLGSNQIDDLFEVDSADDKEHEDDK